MKNKTKTYVLLVLVIGVWGLVIYRIVAALNPELPETPQQQLSLNTNFKMETKRDTFSIKKVERDPFLGTLERSKAKKKKRVVLPQVTWMPIAYSGMLSSGNKNQIFLVSINGEQYLLKKGQTQNEVTLVSGTNESVSLKYQNEIKRFKKQ